tara:strand:- start:613 stop:1434 length:822 start_codon:yes stop_codon:yes gene_type:complete
VPESQKSTFKKLSELIRVNDIYNPFIAEYDYSQSPEEICEEWMEFDCDPFNEIALVKDNQKAIGWIGFDMLDEPSLSEGMEPINGDMLISSDTPLLEAIRTICSGNNHIYLVLKGSKFIGFLSYANFNKLPFRMCLFALLIDLERVMLEVVKSDPTSFLKNLSEKRLDNAKNEYSNRGYKLNKEGKEYDSTLIDCTSFTDKFKMLKNSRVVIQKCPELKSRIFVEKAGKMRNKIAHSEGEESGFLPIEKKDFIPFIDWVERLQNQLDKYFETP